MEKTEDKVRKNERKERRSESRKAARLQCLEGYILSYLLFLMLQNKYPKFSTSLNNT